MTIEKMKQALSDVRKKIKKTCRKLKRDPEEREIGHAVTIGSDTGVPAERSDQAMPVGEEVGM